MTKPINPHQPPQEMEEKRVENQPHNATQLPSQGKRLPQGLQNFLTFLYRIFTFQWNNAAFEMKRSRNDLIDSLLNQLPDDSKKQKGLRAILESFSSEDLKKFSSNIRLINAKILEYNFSPKEYYQQTINALKLIAKAPQNLAILDYPQRIYELLGTRFLPHKKDYLAFLLKVNNQDTINKLEKFLNTAEKIKANLISGQSTAEERLSLVESQNDLSNEELNALQLDTLKEIVISTGASWHFPIIDEAVTALSMPLSDPRNVPYLRPLSFVSKTFPIDNEFHIETTPLPKNLDQVIEFKGHIEIYISDPRTRETVTVRIPLPFKQKITGREAQKLLRLLNEFSLRADTFDQAYQKSGLDFDQQAAIKQSFKSFFDQLLDEIIKGIHRLELQSKSPFESQEVMSYQSSSSYENARSIIKQKRIFKTEAGLLSLLPSYTPDLKPIVTIGTTFIQAVKENLLENKQHKLSFPVMIASEKSPFSNANVSFKTQTIEVNSAKFLELTTEIQGKITSSRKTYYLIPPGKTIDDVVKETISSRLLERDLLLAKADFMEKIAQ